MSLVVAVPEVLSTAATDLASLGSTISAANAAAATRTTGGAGRG
jgi:PE family